MISLLSDIISVNDKKNLNALVDKLMEFLQMYATSVVILSIR